MSTENKICSSYQTLQVKIHFQAQGKIRYSEFKINSHLKIILAHLQASRIGMYD